MILIFLGYLEKCMNYTFYHRSGLAEKTKFFAMNKTVTSISKIVLKHLTHLSRPRYGGTLLWYSLLVVMIGLFCSSCEVLGVWRAWVWFA